MRMTGEQRVAAPRQRVWEALNDPEVLRRAIPGCEALERISDDRLDATVAVKIGPIGARFKGAVTLSDRDPPNGYRLSGEGNAGIAGTARGGAHVRLEDDGAGTLVSYDVDAEVGGRLAQLGGPIIDATARQLADRFFRQLGEVVSGVAGTETPTASAGAASTGTASAAAAATMAPSPAGTGAAPALPVMWLVALAVAIVAGFLLGRSDAADGWVIAVILLTGAAALAGYASGRGR